MENPIKIHDLGVPLFLETPTVSMFFFLNPVKQTHVFSAIYRRKFQAVYNWFLGPFC